jgi:hypothetical protein
VERREMFPIADLCQAAQAAVLDRRFIATVGVKPRVEMLPRCASTAHPCRSDRAGHGRRLKLFGVRDSATIRRRQLSRAESRKAWAGYA